MKIASPLTRVDEIKPLIKAGADEFYCGVCTEGESGLNERDNTTQFNLKDNKELEKAVGIAHKNGKKIILCVNSPVLDLDLAMEQIRTAKDISVDGVTVSSIILLILMKRKKFRYNFNLSCAAPVFNSISASFYKKLGISRICLPKHLGIKGIESVVSKTNGLRFQAFVLSGNCPNIQGYCSLHGLPQYIKKYPCMKFSVKRTIDLKRQRAIPVKVNPEVMIERIRYHAFSCGLCELANLKRMKMDSLKIAGRGIPLETKILLVGGLRYILDLVDNGITDIDLRKEAAITFRKTGKECDPEFCYL
jgi:putative protease